MAVTNSLAPLKTLLKSTRGSKLPLPPHLIRLYGDLRMPRRRSAAWVFSNFVSTLDGVVSLQTKGHSGGGDISGFNTQDHMVMGLLRAIADVIIIGSATFAADPHHVWTPEAICPELAMHYQQLRNAMRNRTAALQVIVSASGNIDLRQTAFAADRSPTLIVTTRAGEKRLAKQRPSDSVNIRSVSRRRDTIEPNDILDEAVRLTAGKRILIEGGPHLLGSFYREKLVDEQFLTLAPQIAGRDTTDRRLSLVMGNIFAPRDPLWGTLTDVRQGHSHLFLRYSFP